MTMIQTVSPQHASGPVAAIYGEITQVLGQVPNGMQLFSASPSLLAQQWESLGYYMQHPSLSFPLLATIRLLCSAEHECDYCVGFNSMLLVNHAGWNLDQVAATKRDANAAPLSPKEIALLQFVLKAVRAPKTANEAEVAALRTLGWSESDIFDAVAHGARNVAVDIIFNTFKVQRDA